MSDAKTFLANLGNARQVAQARASASANQAPVGIGLRIKIWRLARGWSQIELSRRSGVSRASLSGYEASLQSACMTNATLLATTLGTTVQGLFTAPPQEDEAS